MSCCGGPWNITCAAVLAGARPEIDEVVGGANRLLVVLDDEHGVAEIAKPAQRREQTPVVALVQPDRRLVEHVQHAGELRSDLRRQPDALAFAARQRGRAAPERQIADADVDQKPQPVANLPQHAAGDQVLALGELQRLERAAATSTIGRRTYSDSRRPFTRTAPALGLQPIAVARRAGLQRAVALERFLIGPRPFLEPPPQVRDARLRSRRRTDPVGGRLRSAAAAPAGGPARRTARCRAASSAASRTAPAGSMAKVRCSPSSISAISRLSPAAPRHHRPVGERPRFVRHDARRDRSRKTSPSPWHSGHAPCGELNEKARGVISGMLMPHDGHASRRENSRSPPSSVLMTTMSSASFSASSIESARRRSMPPLTISRSISTSIVWLRRRSSAIVFVERHEPGRRCARA